MLKIQPMELFQKKYLLVFCVFVFFLVFENLFGALWFNVGMLEILHAFMKSNIADSAEYPIYSIKDRFLPRRVHLYFNKASEFSHNTAVEWAKVRFGENAGWFDSLNLPLLTAGALRNPLLCADLILFYDRIGDLEKTLEIFESCGANFKMPISIVEIVNITYLDLAQEAVAENNFGLATKHMWNRWQIYEPKYSLTTRVNENWVFVGHDFIDERAFFEGNTQLLWLYWLSDEPTIIHNMGFYGEGTRWIELKLDPNLVKNGGFQDISDSSIPRNWEKDIYKASTENRHIVIQECMGRGNLCVELMNSSVFTQSSFISTGIFVASESCYLLSAWAKSNEGSGYVGVYWVDSEDTWSSYDSIVRGITAKYWVNYRGFVTSTTEAKLGYIGLVNWNSKGSVFFDDVLFVELEGPQ